MGGRRRATITDQTFPFETLRRCQMWPAGTRRRPGLASCGGKHTSAALSAHIIQQLHVFSSQSNSLLSPHGGGGGGSVTSCVKGQHTGGEGVMSCLVSYYIGMTSNSIIIVILE